MLLLRSHPTAGALLLALGATTPAQAATYWNLFNIEGDTTETAQYVTYASLADMLGDSNRLGVFNPQGFGVGANVVGSGSDGKTYWNLFNIEGDATETAQYVTYASLADMLLDSNRLGVFNPQGFGVGANVVGSGSDGSTYWNLFNIEGDTTETAQYVTYASLADMLDDSNRLGVFNPQGFGVGANVVGSGATIVSVPPDPPVPPIPLPAGIWLLLPALALLARTARGRPAAQRSPVSSSSPLRLAS